MHPDPLMTRAHKLAALVSIPTTLVLLSSVACAPPRRVPGPVPAQSSTGSTYPAGATSTANHVAETPESENDIFTDYAVVEPHTPEPSEGPLRVTVVREASSEQETPAPGFDAALVVRELRAASPSFGLCAAPGAEGQVTVQFEVVPGGAVSQVAAMDTSFDSLEVAECVVREVAQLSFAPGPVGGSVSFSFPIQIPAHPDAGT